MMKEKGGFVMRFEEKRFVRITTVMERWDCSKDLIYDLMSRRVLRPWHPEGSVGKKGVRIEVASVLEAEEKGYIEL